MTIALRLPSAGTRRRWPALLALAFALGLSAGLLLPSGRVARACSCLPPPPPAQALEEAAAVFDGSVAGVEKLDPADPYSEIRVHFVVHTQWKGVSEGRVSVRTAGDGAMCGFGFQLERRYLVYATDLDQDGRLETGLCTRTRLWDEAEAEALGPDEPPEAATPWPVWVSQPPPPGCPRCAEPPPPAQALDEAAAVFHGRLIGIEDLGPDADHDHLLRFQSLGWWKGASSPVVTIRLPWSYWFCEGSRWERLQQPDAPEGFIVYAAENDAGELVLERCGRSRPWDAEEAAALGAPQEPDQPTASPTPAGGSETPPPPDPSATPEPCPTLECPPCAGPRPAEEWLEEADAVFYGRVTRIDRVECDHIVHFEVSEVWKGPRRAQLSVFVDSYAWQCSRWYSQGMETVIFARQDPDRGLTIPLCFGIVDGDAREALGPGQPVAGDAPVAHLGGRIRAVAPLPGSDLAWVAQGPRVWAASLGQGEDLQRYGLGLMLPGPVEALAVDGSLGAALVGRTLYALDLSDPTDPRSTGSVSLADLEGALGPLTLNGENAGIALGQGMARVNLVTLEPPLEIAFCGAGQSITDLVLAEDLLAVSTLDGQPGASDAKGRILVYDLAIPGQLDSGPGDCYEPDARIDDLSAGSLSLARVAGQRRLYSMSPAAIAAWDLSEAAAPAALQRWGSDWRPQGFDPRAGDLAVTSDGEVFVSLHRWVGGLYTAGEVLRVLDAPDPTTGRQVETVRRSLRPLDAPLVAADGASGAGRLLMAGPEGLSWLAMGADSALTHPLVTDAVSLAVNLDDPGPVLYALSDQAGLNGFLLNQPDPVHPQPYTFLSGGAERGGMTVDDYRLVMTNYGVTDIRDQKLEIVSLGGAMVPSKQGEIDLRNAGNGLLWAQSGSLLVVRHQGDLVLYDLRDAGQPVQRDRVSIVGGVTDLAIRGGWVYVLHYSEAGLDPRQPVGTRLSLLRIVEQGGVPGLLPAGEAVELPFTVHDGDLPILALDPDRAVLWMAGAIHCPGDPRYLLQGFDVSDPAAPAGIPWAWEDLTERPRGLVYADGQLFVHGEHAYAMDVRNPAIPTWAGELEVSDASALVVHGQTVFAAAGAEGVYLFQPELAWDSDPDAPTPVPQITPSSLPPTPTPECGSTPTPVTPTSTVPSGTDTPNAPSPNAIYLPWLNRG